MMVAEDMETKRLAYKANLLIDKLEEKEEAISRKQECLEALQEEVKKLEQDTDTKQLSEEDDLINFFKDFCGIVQLAYKEEAYIKYSYATKNSEFFYKIEKSTFDEYICQISRLDIKKFISVCVDLSLVKAEKNRRCTYSSGSIQVYYLSKPFIDKILEPALQEEAEEEG